MFAFRRDWCEEGNHQIRFACNVVAHAPRIVTDRGAKTGPGQRVRS
jgi:hypothetical protein